MKKNFIFYFCCLILALSIYEKALIHSLCGVTVLFQSVYGEVLTKVRHHFVLLRKELVKNSLRRIVSFSQKFLVQNCSYFFFTLSIFLSFFLDCVFFKEAFFSDWSNLLTTTAITTMMEKPTMMMEKLTRTTMMENW